MYECMQQANHCNHKTSLRQSLSVVHFINFHLRFWVILHTGIQMCTSNKYTLYIFFSLLNSFPAEKLCQNHCRLKKFKDCRRRL